MTPGDSPQLIGIVAFIKHFGWKRVAVIASSDKSGQEFKSEGLACMATRLFLFSLRNIEEAKKINVDSVCGHPLAVSDSFANQTKAFALVH